MNAVQAIVALAPLGELVVRAAVKRFQTKGLITEEEALQGMDLALQKLDGAKDYMDWVDQQTANEDET